MDGKKEIISFITTIYNESDNIEKFLVSLFAQTKKIDEIIIVDSESTDNTVGIIENTLSRFPAYKKITTVYVYKSNRAQARNFAIHKSKGNIIVCSDSGCILDKKWVERITAPFYDRKVDGVAGFYIPLAKTVFQKCLSTYTCVMEDRVDPDTFLPSSRSIAFRKYVWNKIGGYPEELDTCEDLIFAKRIYDYPFRFVFIKNAFVKWRQESTIIKAFRQMFGYATGDGKAVFIRDSLPLLFLRYFTFGYLLLIFSITKATNLLIFLIIIVLAYFAWAITKNYRYVQNSKALFLLPFLQIISDVAVIIGFMKGYTQRFSILKLPLVIYRHSILLLCLGVFTALLLSVISWGIPNDNHPFAYHMDEWHQLQAIRSVFKFGTPNVQGAANGTMFHFIMTGLYLIPFWLSKIIDPFSIDSAVSQLSLQNSLFHILRLNTVLYAIGSVLAISYISRTYIKIQPIFTYLFFAFSPAFVLLSTYFKYDIALIFWLIIAFWCILWYSSKPSTTRLLSAALFVAIAVGVKISALPLIGSFIIAFFLFHPKPFKNIQILLLTLFISGVGIIIYGMPDLLVGSGNIREYLYTNIFVVPSISDTYMVPLPFWLYLPFSVFPTLFGNAQMILFFVFLILIWISLLFDRKEFYSSNKGLVLILSTILLFFISFLPLKLYAGGNRSLVLLPFISLVVGYGLHEMWKRSKKIAVVLMAFFFVYQFAHTIAWISMKWYPSPQERASIWMKSNIPSGQTISIENIPLYQLLPDLTLKEFYESEYGIKDNHHFNYKVIQHADASDKIILISNEDLATKIERVSNKKDLVNDIQKKYELVYKVKPDYTVFSYFGDDKDFFFGSLVASPLSLSIYKQL